MEGSRGRSGDGPGGHPRAHSGHGHGTLGRTNAATAAAIPQGGMFQRLNARFNKIPVGGRAALGALAGTATAGLGTTGQLAFAGGAVGGTFKG